MTKKTNITSLAMGVIMVLLTIVAMAFSTQAHAEEINLNAPAKQVVEQEEGLADEMLASHAEKKGYCAGKPSGKSGDIVIYWVRDLQGRCLLQKVERIK